MIFYIFTLHVKAIVLTAKNFTAILSDADWSVRTQGARLGCIINERGRCFRLCLSSYSRATPCLSSYSRASRVRVKRRAEERGEEVVC